MTFQRFKDYVIAIAGAATLSNIFIGVGLIGMLIGRPDLIDSSVVTVTLVSIGGFLGWLMVYRSPAPVVTECPTCHQTVVTRPE